jgi:DinB superfamily
MSLMLDFLRDALRQQHDGWNKAMADLTPDQLHYRPNGKGNHIAFIAWHYVRTEDNVVQFVFQNRKPTVWLQEGYDQKFGLPRTAQGTGMPADEAAQLRLPSADQWLAYQHAVWQATEQWLHMVTEAELQHQVKIMPFGGISVLTALRIPILNHGFLHLGQVHHLRTLQGLKSSEL